MFSESVQSSRPYERRYIFWSSYIGILEGKLLTQLEASVIDPQQLKALKSVVREMLWRWVGDSTWCDNCDNGAKLDKLEKITSTGNFPSQKHCKACNMHYDIK